MTELVEGAGTARSTLGGSSFPPIADYGFLSDCEVSALVAPNGNVEWMCLPRMDGPSVFAALLDRGAGQ
jgi:alpha,alpha-trehalase